MIADEGLNASYVMILMGAPRDISFVGADTALLCPN
jgi:hypothetical protein